MNLKRGFFGPAAVACAVAGVIAAGAVPSEATTVYNTLRNEATGLCLDDSFSSGLRAYQCNGLDYQKWELQYVGSDGAGHDYVHLKNAHTGRCVDDSYAYGLRSFGCNGESYQNWKMYTSSNYNAPVVYSNQNTELCMDDSSGYGLRSFQCNFESYQTWDSPYA